MLFKSQVYTQASGSIGGVTYARNSGGMYTRGRGLVTNPNSPAQQSVRTDYGNLSSAWATLTAAQRESWRVYALNTPLTNRLGDALKLTGQQMFLKANSIRLQASAAIAADGPTTFGLATLSPIYVSATVLGAGTADITFVATDGWATVVGGRLLVFASNQQKPTINFFKGPFKFVGAINGAVVPPTSPATITIGPTPTAGNQIFFRFVASDATGRPSAEQTTSAFVS